MRLVTCAAICLGAGACGSEPRDSPTTGVRDTLPDGTVLVRYGPLPESRTTPALPDLSIGVADGDPNLIFGDVRSVEADNRGTIYVLDYQASEIRAYDPEGRYLRTLTRKGEGPSELREANGMVIVGDSAIWVQDHGQWMMIAVDLDGEELTRVKMHVRSYGYVWSGTVNHRGRFWKPTTHSDEVRQYPPKEGLNESRARLYLKSYDPETDVSDSVYVGERLYRTLITRNSRGGYTYQGIPFDPGTMTVVDPAGGFWQASGTAYRIARLTEGGDTVMVIEVAVDPFPVTDRDRERYVNQEVESPLGDRRVAEEVAALMPAVKPAIAGLVVDDAGQLWVRRTRADDGPATYDIFGADGAYVGTVTLGFDAAPFIPIRVRHGRVYAVVRDSLDIPTVVRTGPLPAFTR